MKKKTIFISIAICTILVCLVTCILTGIINIPGINSVDDETDIERIKRVLETTRPTEIFILGSEIEFELNLNNKMITSLNSESIKTDKDYTVVIINDLDGSVSLTDEEISFSKELINKDGYYLMYLGSKYTTTWEKEGEPIAEVDGNLSYSYYSIFGKPKRIIGYWEQADKDILKENPYFLGHILMYAMEDWLLAYEK